MPIGIVSLLLFEVQEFYFSDEVEKMISVEGEGESAVPGLIVQKIADNLDIDTSDWKTTVGNTELDFINILDKR